MDEKLAELIGIMAGDGCLSTYCKKYMIYISGHKKDDLEYHTNITKKLFQDIFNKETSIQLKKSENTLFIRFSDKDIFKILSNYLPIGNKYEKLKIPIEIINNKRYFFNFMRGFSDTDGSIIFSKQHKEIAYYPRIEIASKSKNLLNSILSKLKENGFYGSVSHKGKKAYRLELPGTKNLTKWLKEIGFNNNKHIRKIEDHLRGLQRPKADSNCRPCD